MTRTITLFGSSKPREGDPEYTLARTTGRLLAEAGFSICNGGYRGTMEASARGAREAHGRTIGVTVSTFPATANPYIQEEIKASSLWDRIRLLMEHGDAYLIFKGSTGTLLEFAAVWESVNKGLMPEKPILVLGGFWKSVVETMRMELEEEGMADCTRLVHRFADPEACVQFLKEHFSRT